MKKTGIVADARYREHDPGDGHPERPERYDVAVSSALSAAPGERILQIKPRSATEREILLCHTKEYHDQAKDEILTGWPSLGTGDTDVCPRSYEIALLAAGGVLAAVDAVMEGKVRNAFCPVRPPGHHATANRGMGFCVFNNVAIGARYAQRKHGVARVLIVDWDIHHGNGTQAIFYEDPTVFYFSTHQWPFYPGSGRADDTGMGAGKGYTINCPCARGSGRTEIVGAFNERLVPAMRDFKPEFVFVSAGFDSREEDLLGQFVLTDADFAELTGIVMSIAADYSGGRIVSVLEGGYSLDGLGSAIGAHVRALSSVAARN